MSKVTFSLVCLCMHIEEEHALRHGAWWYHDLVCRRLWDTGMVVWYGGIMVAWLYSMIARWYGTYVDVLVRDNTPPRDSGNPPSDITSSHFFRRRASSNLCVIFIIIFIISIFIIQCHVPSHYGYDKFSPGSENFITIIILIITISPSLTLFFVAKIPHLPYVSWFFQVFTCCL